MAQDCSFIAPDTLQGQVAWVEKVAAEADLERQRVKIARSIMWSNCALVPKWENSGAERKQWSTCRGRAREWV